MTEKSDKLAILIRSRTVVWYYHEATKFVRRLERKLKVVEAHVTFTGSVLHKGWSKKDLDLIIYPHQSQRFDLELIRDALRAAGMRCVFPVGEVHRDWRERGIKDKKVVEVWVVGRGRNRKRVDIMFLK